MAARERTRCRGATLLEVLTVTAITVTLLAIGVPQMTKLRAPYVLASASRQIATDLQAARLRAIARNTRYRVNFNSAAKTYTLESESSPNTFVAEGGAQTLPRGATVTAPSPGNPIFDTRGMLGSDVTVSVSVAGSGTRTVTVNVLGRTTIS
jgi:Tfp pilus assembly protein FimT